MIRTLGTALLLALLVVFSVAIGAAAFVATEFVLMWGPI